MFIFFANIPLYAIEGGPAVSKIYNLSFQKNKIGIVLDIDRTSSDFSAKESLRYAVYEANKIKILSAQDFKAEFPEVKKIEIFNRDYSPPDEKIEDTKGNLYKIKYSKCESPEEGDTICTKVSIKVDGKDILLDLTKDGISKSGTKIVSIERWGNQLWMGFAQRGENSLYGDGVGVIEISSGKLIKKIYNQRSVNTALDDARPLATIIKKDPEQEVMWIGGSYGLYSYDQKMNLIHTCNLLVAYIGKDGANQTALKDRLEFTCDK